MLRQKSAHSGGKVGFRFAAEKCTLSGKFGGGRLRRKSTHSSENLAPKNRTFGRKGVILLNRVAIEKCTLIEKSGGEKAHILKERCDFACCSLR